MVPRPTHCPECGSILEERHYTFGVCDLHWCGTCRMTWKLERIVKFQMVGIRSKEPAFKDASVPAPADTIIPILGDDCFEPIKWGPSAWNRALGPSVTPMGIDALGRRGRTMTIEEERAAEAYRDIYGRTIHPKKIDLSLIDEDIGYDADLSDGEMEERQEEQADQDDDNEW